MAKELTARERAKMKRKMTAEVSPQFTIKQWDISKLKRAEYNPRKIDPVAKEQLRKSVTKFGIVEPTVVNVNPERYGIVVGGHQRLTIYQEQGYEEVPVVEVNLSLEDEKELNLRLNKNVGGWDNELLKNFFGKDELKGVGFLDSELAFFDEEKKKELFESEPQYPIVAKVDEGYDAIVIFCKSNMDALWLRELMGVTSERSYKCKAVGETRVVSVEKFREVLEREKEQAVMAAAGVRKARKN